MINTILTLSVSDLILSYMFAFLFGMVIVILVKLLSHFKF